MTFISAIRFVEQFHLLFLVQLSRRLNPSLFVLKGGCNLRFFLGSVRYSEDVDLDLADIGPDVFRDKVQDILTSRPFAQILEARGVAIERVSAPKQTETTQRWKLGLRLVDSSATLPTKIECSRRGLDSGVAFGSVDARIVRDYQLPPVMLSHYDAGAALRQKIGALAGRVETQARDVFDVHHLLASGTAQVSALGVDDRLLERASASAMAIDFATFKSQVLAFLEPDDQARFDASRVWDAIVLEVVDALQGGRR